MDEVNAIVFFLGMMAGGFMASVFRPMALDV